MTPPEHFAQINQLKEILGFKIPLDGLLMVALQRPIIDIIKLDNRLMKDFNYKGSMSDFIKSKFGDEALRIMEENIA
jgi:hypothetical protein